MVSPQDPTPKHPFSWPELENGQNELLSGQNVPNWAKCLKSGQNISRSGQKKNIHLMGLTNFAVLALAQYLHVQPVGGKNAVAARLALPTAVEDARKLQEMSSSLVY